MPPPLDPDALTSTQLKELVVQLLAEVAALKQTVVAQREEIARLHFDALGFTILATTPDPVLIATEGALWGSIAAHNFVRDAVVLGDDAGQFSVGAHALCWCMPSGWCTSLRHSPISTARRSSACAA